MHGLAPMHICRRFIHRIADHPRLLHAGMHAQSCLTLCDPMDSSPPGSSVHGILQAKILEWVAIPFSRGSSQLRDQTWVSCIAGRFFTGWAIREIHQTCFSPNVLISGNRIINLSLKKKKLPWTYISLLTVLPFIFLSLTFKQQILLVPPSKCILPLTNFHCLPYYTLV